jgi:nicotinamidase-related amidase
MREVLVVIDMINGFVNFGNLHDPSINKITPDIIKLIEKTKKSNQPIVSFQDEHESDDKEFKKYPPHCIKGTPECELIPELKPYEKDMIIFKKNETDGMLMPKIKKFFKENSFDRVTLTGCCTDICVQEFALSLKGMFSQIERETQIVVPENCVATYDSPNHPAADCHRGALEVMQKTGIIIKCGESENKSDSLNKG